MIKAYTYAAEDKGPRLLILGAVHGNEVCGPLAIRKIMDRLDSGDLRLVKGQVQFVPVSNPRAYEAGQRSMERNLNRYFLPTENPTTYEAKLTNILCPMIEATDYFIDLHSTTAGGMPFASIEGHDDEEIKIAVAMGAEVLLFGWSEAYRASGKVNLDPTESAGTTAYARQQGAKGVLLECGQHKDPASVDVAYKAILGALRHIGLIEGASSEARPAPLLLRTTQVVYRFEGGQFTENWGNFSPVKAGQLVATRADGTEVRAPNDGYVILPNPNTPPDTEWLYFGEVF